MEVTEGHRSRCTNKICEWWLWCIHFSIRGTAKNKKNDQEGALCKPKMKDEWNVQWYFLNDITYLLKAWRSCKIMMDRFCKQAKTSCGGKGPPSGWTQWLVSGSKPRALNTSKLQHNRNQKISGGQQNEQKTRYTSINSKVWFLSWQISSCHQAWTF